MADRVFPVPSFASSLPIPPGWREKTNPANGRVYYIDEKARTSTYDDPRFRPLPVGWEMKWDAQKQKPYFSDYKTRSTTYEDPRLRPDYKPPQNTSTTKPSVPSYAAAPQAATPTASYAQVPQQMQQNWAPTMQMNPQQAQQASVDISINGKKCTEAEIQILRSAGSPCLPGSYWYDSKAGGFGMMGGPCLGWAVPNLNIGGPLPANASNGNTGVFINGRQLHMMDVMNWNTYIGPCLPGRYTLDGMGNCCYENGMFIANVYALMQAKSYHYKGSTGLSSADIEFLFST